MATSFIFDGKKIKRPGVYSQIKSGIKNPPASLDFGNVLILDTGIGASWNGGAGINGELESGKDAIYSFQDVSSYKDFVQGGILWDLGESLFRPSALGTAGASNVTIVRAATTVGATISYTFTGGGAAGGTFACKVKSEGLVGNGAVDTDGNLTKGFAGLMKAGVIDTSKFVLEFYKTGFVGVDSDGDAFNFVSASDSSPELLARSVEFSNIAELIAWGNSDFNFKQFFELTSASVVTGTGVVDTDDLAANLSFELAAGGTESFSSDDLDAALDAVSDLSIDFILASDYGATPTATSANNLKILAWIAEEAKIKPDLYVGGGLDVTEFSTATGSLATATFFDSQFVTVVHGGVKKNTPNGVKIRPSIYHAASVLGREAGLAPQVPLTFKNIRVDGIAHLLNSKEEIQGLDGGVLMTNLDNGSFDIVKGINSLQRNDNLINEDGTTSSKQIRRVSRQINKELLFNVKRDLLKQPNGVNRNTLTAQDVEEYVKGYLRDITANSISDNLILGFQNVVVELDRDAYRVNYEIITNREISFVLLTGFIVE
ncbi:hypothetical protein [Lutibacter sp.]|uniref:hypothetical protein n=1 Tax=Lutibacter sp. TaxID=1925666 RepID=UPI0034A01287